MADAAQIAQALHGRPAGPGRWTARCPVPSHGRGRGDRTPSLSLRDEGGKVLVHCHAGCDQQDVIDTLRVRGLWKTPDGARLVAQVAEADSGLALDLWREAKPAEGTPVEIYLRRRGITLSIPATLRFHQALLHKRSGLCLPAMLAAMAHVPQQRVVAIHRTYLTEDGRKAQVDPAKMGLGPIGAGAVRLSRAGLALGLAEGIETALSAMQLFDIPVWAALGARFDQVELPRAVIEVQIFGDNGGPGHAAGKRAVKAFTGQGKRVALRYPPERFGDWNDALGALTGTWTT